VHPVTPAYDMESDIGENNNLYPQNYLVENNVTTKQKIIMLAIKYNCDYISHYNYLQF